MICELLASSISLATLSPSLSTLLVPYIAALSLLISYFFLFPYISSLPRYHLSLSTARILFSLVPMHHCLPIHPHGHRISPTLTRSRSCAHQGFYAPVNFVCLDTA